MKRCGNCFHEYEAQYDVCPHCGYYVGQPPRELYQLFPGTLLAGRYLIGQVLGFGGFGNTYKAWDTKLETVVAIKEYYPSGLVNRIPGQNEVILFAGNKAKEYNYGLERFLDEAKNMAKFSSHKNIVNVFEFFEENNTAYIVMEFLDGISLSGFLKENEMDVESSIDLIINVCAALKEIHSSGIIHRDVSPDNIFVCFNGNIKLIDFGAARFSSNEERQMTVIIKPGFAPPEQYEQISAQGPWTDIYALGATLYRMLTGEKPDESTNRKIEDIVLPPHELNPDISENLSNTVMKAMALERHLRFASVEEFEKALNGKKKVTTLAKEKKRRRTKRIMGIVAAATVVLTAIGILGMSFLAQKEAETLPEANIELWYVLTGDQLRDEAKADALNSAVETFMNSYPDVTINLVGVEQNEYWDSVREAVANTGEEQALAVFESTMFTSEQLTEVSCDISSVIASSNADSCYFFDDYNNHYPDKNQMPLGFIAPIIYCNKTITEYADTSAAGLDELLDQTGDSKGIAVHVDVKTAVIAAFGDNVFDNANVTVVENSDAFVAGEYAFYIAASSEFNDIQSKLPARYSLAAFATEAVVAELTDVYSVSADLTADEQKVAFAFMNFLLSDNVQDYYFVQNWTGNLPLNSSVLAVIEDVYSDFSGFFDNIEDYSFE